jgi:BRCT domain type II-containing protein
LVVLNHELSTTMWASLLGDTHHNSLRAKQTHEPTSPPPKNLGDLTKSPKIDWPNGLVKAGVTKPRPTEHQDEPGPVSYRHTGSRNLSSIALAKTGTLKGLSDRSDASALIRLCLRGVTSSPSVKLIQTILQQNSRAPFSKESRTNST